MNYINNFKITSEYYIHNYIMVCLNDKLPIDYTRLRSLFAEELTNIIENEIHYIDGLKHEKKEKIKNNIINAFKSKMNSNFIIEQVIHKDNCIYKYKKGKKDGIVCCKKITKNGDKDKYVCTTHNKNHIPKSKNSIEKLETNKYNNIYSPKSFEIIKEKNVIRNSKIYKKCFRNNIKNKTYIGNININLIMNSLKKYSKCSYSENMICKYNNEKLCYNIAKYGKCRFKHKNNPTIYDFLNDINRRQIYNDHYVSIPVTTI